MNAGSGRSRSGPAAGPEPRPGAAPAILVGTHEAHPRRLPPRAHALVVHTYGIGLAVTFWFAYRYFERRLRKNGYPTDWFAGMFLWIVVASIVGARAFHVLANLSTYYGRPRRDPARSGTVACRRSADCWSACPPASSWPAVAAPSCSTLPRARHRGPRAHGRLGCRTAARPPAHGGRWWTPDPRVVRHVLRRPGRQALAGPDPPGGRQLHHLRRPPAHRALLPGDRPVGFRPGPCSASAWSCGASTRFYDERLWLGEIGHLGSVLVQSPGWGCSPSAARRHARRPPAMAGLVGRRRARRPPGPRRCEPTDGGARRPGAPLTRCARDGPPHPSRARPCAQPFGLSPDSAAARYSSSWSIRAIRSWPTVESRRAAISLGVQRPAA